MRLTLLFENLSQIQYEPLRRTIFKMLSFSIWREHPGATVVRSVFGFAKWPSLSDWKQGKSETYEVLAAYDFTFSPQDESPE